MSAPTTKQMDTDVKENTELAPVKDTEVTRPGGAKVSHGFQGHLQGAQSMPVPVVGYQPTAKSMSCSRRPVWGLLVAGESDPGSLLLTNTS